MSIPKVGDKVLCIKSESVFYKLDQEYEIVKKNGTVGTVGSDGVFDEWGKTLSKFKIGGQPKLLAVV